MADHTKTGNVLLDAWIDALKPLIPGPAADPGNPASAPPWSAVERMFFGAGRHNPVDGSAGWPGDAAQLTQVWSDLAQRSLGALTAMSSNANAGDPLGEALEESFGVLGQVGGAAAEGPALLAEATRVSGVLLAAREAYRAVMLATWQRALEEVTREAVRRAGDGKAITTPSQWLSMSNEVADRVFVEAFNSPAYIDVQRRLSTALADQRRAEMNLVEFFARFGHVATRRALDGVGSEVSDLRRRVRRLERATRGASGRGRKGKAVDD